LNLANLIALVIAFGPANYKRPNHRSVACTLASRLLPNSPLKNGLTNRLPYWKIIARNLKKAGWSLGWVSDPDLESRTIWIADAHRDEF